MKDEKTYVSEAEKVTVPWAKPATEVAEVVAVETIEPENRLAVIVKESGLEPAKANVMLTKFQDSFEMAAKWEKMAKMIVVTSPAQTADMVMARTGRLELKKKRTEIETTRKELKEQALREGKAIDGIANVLKALIVPIEEYLDRQERFVEIKETEEKERQKVLRISELSALAVDVSSFDLLNMPEEAYTRLRDGIRLEIKNRKAAEAKAEADRVAKERADAEERQRMIAENARLAEEAEKREAEFAKERARLAKIQEEKDKAAVIERANAEAERKRIEEETRLQREQLLAEQAARELKAKTERIRLETIAKKEREEAEAAKERVAKEMNRLAAELQMKKDQDELARIQTENKAKAEAKAKADAEKKAAAAPDKTKIVELAKLIEAIKMPEVKTAEAKKIIADAKGLLSKVQLFLIQKSEAL